VRALARSATAIRSHDPKLEKVDGDALDRHTIERAVVGVDVVIQTLGVSPTPELIFSGTRLFSVATRILVDAMEATTIKRLICVTGLGAGDSRGYGGPLYNVALSLFLGRIYADKDAQEWIIRRSSLDWTIARPTVPTTGPRTGAYRVLVDARDWRSGFISRADVAAELVDAAPSCRLGAARRITDAIRRVVAARVYILTAGSRAGKISTTPTKPLACPLVRSGARRLVGSTKTNPGLAQCRETAALLDPS
jgi:putative NADH-flavin reductase